LRVSEIYVVFFSLNGGMGTPLEARSVTAGGLSTPSRPLSGGGATTSLAWYTAAGVKAGNTYIPSGSRTLYAKWIELTATNLVYILAWPPTNTADTPHTISFAIGTSISGNWADINSTVQNTGKFVILDLSLCIVSKNTITGSKPSSPHQVATSTSSRTTPALKASSCLTLLPTRGRRYGQLQIHLERNL
jgi:hypothetical protein